MASSSPVLAWGGGAPDNAASGFETMEFAGGTGNGARIIIRSNTVLIRRSST